MSNWLSRIFTIPRKKREELNADPVVHELGQALQSLAIASAQAAVDKHISDPALAEQVKQQIHDEVQRAIPIPDEAPAQPANQDQPFAPFPRSFVGTPDPPTVTDVPIAPPAVHEMGTQ